MVVVVWCWWRAVGRKLVDESVVREGVLPVVFGHGDCVTKLTFIQ